MSGSNLPGSPLERIVRELQERAKELSCLYKVDEILSTRETPTEETLRAVVDAVPAGWQYPSVCRARIVLRGRCVQAPDFEETPWLLTAPIVVQGVSAGALTVCYLRAMPEVGEGPFLREERKLIDSLAQRVGQFVLHKDLAAVFDRGHGAPALESGRGWRVAVELLRRTDPSLLRRVCRRMLTHLAWTGVERARELLASGVVSTATPGDDNAPRPRQVAREVDAADDVFKLAVEHLGERETLGLLEVWVKEDRVNFLLQALETSGTSLVQVANALERYQHAGLQSHEMSRATQAGLKAALARRLLSDDPAFLSTCQKWATVEDFVGLVDRTVVLPQSHGRLGGKASGLFLASRVLERSGEFADLLGAIRTPRTWYVPSDGLIRFVAYNDLDDLFNWKYRELSQIRQEYPHVVQLFKSAHFPPEVVNGLSAVLDQLGDRPLIVRSSSLLEDRMGSAFSGKYKSLFLANQGAKPDRLAALLDAVAEVYASVFGPDPVQYRIERGLLEHHEEMGVMVQEVVGRPVGHYFLPAFSGVGFSHNEFRWSPRIRREDGLLRIVPGLGTRAVDRVGDDFPVLVAPGQPGLRVNVTPDEILRYSPKRIDVIDLRANAFTTLDVKEFLAEVGPAYPALNQLVSVVEPDRLRLPLGAETLDPARLVFTFEGLLSSGAFLTRMRTLLNVLRDSLGTGVDVEFAHDGEELFLLQCRPQSRAPEASPAQIPRDLPPSSVLFSAHRYVSSGSVPDLTHLVYVDPDAYAALPDAPKMREVGRAVSALNAALPRRQFALLGPGRWGSRGDVRLGVSVTYADISNTALLIEIARRRGNYAPELSFGTHFFQDLVEASIRYLPLYPEEPGVRFDEGFFRGAPNDLGQAAPAFAHLGHVVRVIDVPRATGGKVVRVLMNGDLDEAVAFLATRGS